MLIGLPVKKQLRREVMAHRSASLNSQHLHTIRKPKASAALGSCQARKLATTFRSRVAANR